MTATPGRLWVRPRKRGAAPVRKADAPRRRREDPWKRSLETAAMVAARGGRTTVPAICRVLGAESPGRDAVRRRMYEIEARGWVRRAGTAVDTATIWELTPEGRAALDQEELRKMKEEESEAEA